MLNCFCGFKPFLINEGIASVGCSENRAVKKQRSLFTSLSVQVSRGAQSRDAASLHLKESVEVVCASVPQVEVETVVEEGCVWPYILNLLPLLPDYR